MTNSSLIRLARFVFRGLGNPSVAFVGRWEWKVCTGILTGGPILASDYHISSGIEIEVTYMKATSLPMRRGRRIFVWGYGPKSNTLFVWEGL